ncbi:O-methyltransferase [Mizugakiibacter sediminis]|uniref:O-methyltransferase n=1 Tax=Mizugakiibacter sediminis TaxID=1475481 RepID=A0A0K8QPY0_9GAMM|nr:class I SAM-dependent methyltransferase [Mizugakiibacter sediminis]GAP66746.1 O-methyltransferase [Mizugakiibacter sediminis]
MSRRLPLTDALEQYVRQHTRESDVQRRLREETAKLPQAGMQIGPDQAACFAVLVRATGARRALEIGTFTGYSALAVAQALPADGRLVCCDISREWTDIARRYWQEAGVAGRIELRLGPAQRTLDALLREGHAGGFDFAFIDADKTGYDGYYERCLELLRPNGLLAIDNVLWSGAVADPARQDEDTVALRALNAKIRDDARVEPAMLTIGDGVTLLCKR